MLPEKELTQVDVETLWLVDRVNLKECRSRHGALLEFYQDRDARLKGTKPHADSRDK